MIKKISFLKLLTLVYVSLVFVISIIVSITSINNSKNDFFYESEKIISISHDKKKDLVKREVEKAIDDLNRYSSSIDVKSKDLVKLKVQNSFEIIKNVYNKYKTIKSKDEIIDIIKTVLGTKLQNENTELSYFIITLDGLAKLFTEKPALESTNLINHRFFQGPLVFKEMIDLMKVKNESFYSCFWNKDGENSLNNENSKGNNREDIFNRISFIKVFRPLNIFIGTGFFIDDYISDLKITLLKDIKNIRFGVRNSGYLAVISNDGIILTTDEKQSSMVGNDITSLKDTNGKNIYKELLRASFSNHGKGGFSTYNWLDPSSNIISEKITFVKRFDDFGWMISGGAYTNDINKEIEKLKIDLEKQLDKRIRSIIITTVISIVVLLVMIYFINLRLKKDYFSLILFLKNLSSKNEKIDIDKIRFTEVEDIVIYANEMLEEKLKSDKILIESEVKFRTLTESTNIGVLLHRTNQILYVNNVISKITGYKVDELIKMTFFDIVHEESKQFVLNNFENEIEGSSFVDHYDLKINTKDKNRICWINITVNEIVFEGEKTNLISALDITDRKEEQNLLFRERERLKVTLESIGDGVITTDSEGVIRFINPSASKITGYSLEEAKGKDLIDILNIYYEADKRRIINPLKKVKETKERTVFNDHPYLLSKDNKEYRISNSTAPIIDEKGHISGVVVVFRDITKFIETEVELKKINNIESLGILAGGIAHDFNNLLSGMFGNLSLAKLFLAKTDKAYENIKIAEDAMGRATALSNQLLTFSKGGDPVKSVTNLKEFIKESAEFSLSGSNVKLFLEIEENLLLAEIDRGQINQVISNLVINASQSMQEGGNLYLDITNQLEGEPLRGTNRVDILTRFIDNSKYDDFVQIKIRDKGSGIEKGHLSKIFDPYFTTKIKGKGLGLATVHSIITKHNGLIIVDSIIGKGTEFTILLPASKEITNKIEKESERKRKQIFSNSKMPLEERKSYKILIMDDELAIRNLLKEMMSILGHEAYETCNGEELISEYSSSMESGQKKYEIVFMDLTIPGGMGAEQTIKDLLTIDPNAKVVLASGYTNNTIMANYKEFGFSARIAKPFRVDQLMNIIEEVVV